jgi:uncharacterized membrane protein
MIRKGLIGSVPLLVLIAAFAVVGWTMVPAGAEIAVHWSASGEVNRTGGRFEAFGAIPLTALVLTAVFVVAPHIDPRGRNLQRSAPLWLAAWLGSLIVLAVAQGFITLAAIGIIEPAGSVMPRMIGSLVAAFLIVIGNYLGKARPNWFAGIRTPWTLSSDRSWDITHRWGARLFAAAGAVSILALWLTPEQTGWVVMVAAVMIAALVPIVLSYFVWRSDPERETYSAADRD